MKSNGWQQIESIFHTALDLKGEKRSLYLSRVCLENDLLRSEIESLIDAFETESSFLENPVLDLGFDVLQQNIEVNLAGQIIGNYKIKVKIGAGGMGDVYLAEDTRLNRNVALKFLKDSFLDDKWAKRQFIREAQSVAMLDHSNICTVYNIEEIDRHNFIVMQYIEGITLSQYIADYPINIEDVLVIARQIIGALAAAHSHGIIHRDIKPGNIMMTAGNQVKVLDFGLAKVIQQKQKAPVEGANTSQITNNQLIMGTISYMSPEQLRAEKLDFSSDIFSFGILLYELLTKRNPFQRKSQAETIAAVLVNNPDAIREIGLQVPNTLESIILKCLDKEKEKRFQSAFELQIELDNVKNGKNNYLFQKSINIRNFSVLAFLLLLISAVIFIYSSTAVKVTTFAILPIVNESNNSENDYLSDGLTDNLINRIARLSKIRIKPSTTVSRYKGQNINPQQAGKELGVEVVLIGKIIQKGSSILFSATLINTSDGSQIWSNEYQIEGDNLVISQEEITNQITSKLRVVLSKDEKLLLNKPQTTNPEAAKEYFLGRFYWNKRDKNNILTAIQHFNNAIELDPLFAQAWAGLAGSYALLNVPAYGALNSKDAALKAKNAAMKALELDDTLGEAYTSLGIINLRYEWNWGEAEANFQKAINLSPDYAPTHFWYSNLLILKEQFEQALDEGQKARNLDPLFPNYDINIGRIMYFQRDNERAIQILTETLKNYPQNANAAYLLALTYLQKGLTDEAIVMLEKFYQTDKIYFATPLGYAYGKAGRVADATKIMTELKEAKQAKQEYLPPQEEAIIYLGIGDKDKAFEQLELSCRDRYSAFPFLLKEQITDGLRTDSRFSELQNCVKSLL